MPQNLKHRSPRVWARIDPEQDYEVRYWAQKLGVGEEQLRETVRSVGPIVEKVREHFARQHRGN
jgi:hypothetical protein